MFGVSFAELLIVCIVAIILMKPRDIHKVAHWYKYIFKKIMEFRSIAQESIDKINDSLEEDEPKVVKHEYVIDANNKLERTYNTNPFKRKKNAKS